MGRGPPLPIPISASGQLNDNVCGLDPPALPHTSNCMDLWVVEWVGGGNE